MDVFDASILEVVAHRPWSVPDRPWVMTQTCHDLLFAHWPIKTRDIRTRVPAAFELDLYKGTAWIGIVPFHMTNVAPRGLPSLPWVSEFPEINVRTYVRADNRPGVYFLSLDAGSALAVQATRLLLNLPYYSASMRVEPYGAVVHYDSRRDGTDAAMFTATYGPTGPAVLAAEGSLDHFLTERYCLYHVDHSGAPYRLDIHHPRWPLQPAAADLTRNSMAEVNGIALPDRTPLLHYVKRQDMVAWMPTGLNT
jgi:uncharacterized protein YqjF (DUF2071 family)